MNAPPVITDPLCIRCCLCCSAQIGELQAAVNSDLIPNDALPVQNAGLYLSLCDGTTWEISTSNLESNEKQIVEK